MVIMNPDSVTIMQLRGDHFGEEEVNFIVSFPRSLVNEANFMQLVMEQWPQGGIYAQIVNIKTLVCL